MPTISSTLRPLPFFFLAGEAVGACVGADVGAGVFRPHVMKSESEYKSVTFDPPTYLVIAFTKFKFGQKPAGAIAFPYSYT